MSALTVDYAAAPTDGLFVVAHAPAGWYDVGDGRRRWFDGRQWTEHYAPILTLVDVDYSQPEVAPLPAVTHGLHLVMAIMTLGAWMPVWGLLTLRQVIRRRRTRR